MGILLRGATGDFALNNQGWVSLLRLAWDYGWRPRGTLPPEHWQTPRLQERASEWPAADYVTGRGQRVTAIDAQLLADALGAVLDDLPNDNPIETDSLVRVRAPGFPQVSYISEARTVHTFEQFGGDNKHGFAEFLRFCRSGGFSIW